MSRGRHPTLLVLLAVLALGGCDSLTGPDSRRVLGTVVHVDGEPLISVPDTVEAGEPFTVSVTTTWPDTCGSLDETEVRASGTEVHVIPWDRVDEADDCAQVIEEYDHSVTLSRATPAVLDLTVHGRRMVDGSRSPIEIVYEVVVREP